MSLSRLVGPSLPLWLVPGGFLLALLGVLSLVRDSDEEVLLGFPLSASPPRSREFGLESRKRFGGG